MMMFVLGMLAWQVVTTVVCLVSEDSDTTASFGCGIFSLVAAVAIAIINKIRLHNSRKYNLYQFFGREGSEGQPIWITNYYMTEQDAERFNLIDRDADPEAYSVRLIREGKEFKSIPSTREILTAEMIDNGGVSGMSKDFFEKLFKRA